MPLEKIRKIAVFRALQLGDMLCAIPAVRALKKVFPEAEITLIGLPWSVSLLERFPHYWINFISFPGFHGFPEQDPDETEWESFLKTVQQASFDLVIQLQGSGTLTNSLVRTFGARYYAGSYSDHKPEGFFVRYADQLHEVHRLLNVIKAIDDQEYDDALEFPLFQQEHIQLQRSRLDLIPHSYVCIHPGARDAKRRWDPDYFALIADMMQAKGYIVVLTGIEAERTIVEQVKKQMRSKPILAVGLLSLGGLAALIRNAAYLISNCTGVAHLAVAVHTKSIVLSLEKEPWRWAPLQQDHHRTIVIDPSIAVHEVITAINAFLEPTKCLPVIT